MSNQQNDLFIESLYERISNIDRVTTGAVDDLNRYIAEGDLSGAEALVETQEAIYADDL